MAPIRLTGIICFHMGNDWPQQLRVRVSQGQPDLHPVHPVHPVSPVVSTVSRISGVGRPISASRYASQCVKYFRNIGGIPTPESHWGHEETCPICRFLPSRCFNLDDRQNQRCGSPDFGIKIRIPMREIFQKYWRHSHFSITLGCGCLVAIWPCQDNAER